MKGLIISLFIFAVVLCCHGEGEKKRILLSDIDIEQLVHDVQILKQKVQEQQTQISLLSSMLSSKVASGAIYTRWGRQVCPGNGTQLVYEGFAGGGPYDQDGAAVNYVCLPHDPDFYTGDVSMSPYGHMSTMYGAEYEDNYFGQNMFQKDVPCAVCRVTPATSVMMIPGKSKCIPGWKLEYMGRLAAGGDDGHGIVAASEYVCVDYNPISLDGGEQNEDGKLFVPVKAMCGTLRCPPYKNDAFLTCAVCSK